MVIVMNSLTLFSQKDTTPKVKCFPIPVAKLIAKDLLRGDSAIALLKATEKHVNQLEREGFYKDSVIGNQLQKQKNFDTIISYERAKYDTLNIYTKKLETELKVEKVKTKWLRWGNWGLLVGVGVVAYLLK